MKPQPDAVTPAYADPAVVADCPGIGQGVLGACDHASTDGCVQAAGGAGDDYAGGFGIHVGHERCEHRHVLESALRLFP